MNHTYNIEGMTCEDCKAKVTRTLEGFPEIDRVDINLSTGKARVTMNKHISTSALQSELTGKGNYTITEEVHQGHVRHEENKSFIVTYKPLLMIVGFIAGTSLLVQYPYKEFSGILWMRHFMAGFFIVFSFFKLLNLRGFVDSYRMYDIVAERWKSWGYIYPFVELALGMAYLVSWNPWVTNITTVIVLGISTIGVVKSNLDKRKIQCACLGDVFDLPMSKVTIIEDVSMVMMAALMLAV
ncbi:MAG: heavy-metal-associated domain-containing protein [Roseivirga sp.]|nr:heavy-metal-associated domain-containing protein [Roseivirga sp.]